MNNDELSITYQQAHKIANLGTDLLAQYDHISEIRIKRATRHSLAVEILTQDEGRAVLRSNRYIVAATGESIEDGQ